MLIQEGEWYRTAHNAVDKESSASVYRSIRWDEKKDAFVLISGRRNPGYSGNTDVTEVMFDNPEVLPGAIIVLDAFGAVSLNTRGTVTRSHEDWDHSQASFMDNRPPDVVEKGMVSVELSLENGVLAPFEATVKPIVEK